MGKLINLTGQRFGLLTVIERNYEFAKMAAEWLCKCDCGGTYIARGQRLRSGEIRSCGCLILKHGHSSHDNRSPTYRSWHMMLQRCTNPNALNYRNYGGRGIIVCERWNNFCNFLEDMGVRPEGMTLDRYPNNNGNYETGNCRWATPKEQIDNRRMFNQ